MVRKALLTVLFVLAPALSQAQGQDASASHVRER